MGSDFSVRWYQPKFAPYYLNQMRFDPGTTVRAWHWDGRTNAWTKSATDIVIKAEMGASVLMAGAAVSFLGMLAF